MDLSKEKSPSLRSLKNSQIDNSTNTIDSLKPRKTYLEIFKDKLNYVGPNFSLSEKPIGTYSNLYKDGIRMFDDLEKNNNNSIVNSLKNSGIGPSKSEKSVSYINNRKKIKSPFKNNLLKNPYERLNFHYDINKSLDKKKKGKKSKNKRIKSEEEILSKTMNEENIINEIEKELDSEIENNDEENKNEKMNQIIYNENEKKIDNRNNLFRKSNGYDIKKYNHVYGVNTFNPNRILSLKEWNFRNNQFEKLKFDLYGKNNLNNNRFFDDYLFSNYSNNRSNFLFGNNKGFFQNLFNSGKKFHLKNYKNHYSRLIKHSHSCKNKKSKSNKYFNPNDPEIQKFLKRSKTYDFLFSHKDFYLINDLLNDLHNNFYKTNGIRKGILKDFKTNSIYKRNGRYNLQNTHFKTLDHLDKRKNLKFKNSYDHKRKNLKSLLLINGKKVDDTSNLSFVDSLQIDYFNNDDTNERINLLINKLKQSSQEKNNLLKCYRDQYKKDLKELQNEKNNLQEKKLIHNKEKQLKKVNEKLKTKNINNSIKKGHYKTLSINLRSKNYNLNEFDNDKKDNDNDIKNLTSENEFHKAKSDINLLTESNSSKDYKINSTERKYNKIFSVCKTERIDLNNNYALKSRNNNKFKIRKSESDIFDYNRNNNNFTEKNNYINKVKEDLEDLKKGKLNNSTSYSYNNLNKINRKINIMPVNKLNDVVEMKDFYYNLNTKFK